MDNHIFEIETVDFLKNEILRVRMSDLLTEKELCFRLTEKAKYENDSYALVFSYTFLGDYYLAVKENQKAYNYLTRAEMLGERNAYEDLLSRVYKYIGMYYSSIYDEITAMDYYLKSLRLAEKDNDYLEVGSVYNNIACCFEAKKDYYEALKYYKKSLGYVCKQQDESYYSIALALTNLCNCCRMTKELGEIKTYMFMWNKIPKEKFSAGMYFMRDFCESLVCEANQDREGFYLNIQKMLNRQEKIEDALLVYQVLLNVCRITLELNNRVYTEKCLIVLKEISSKEGMRTAKEVEQFIIEYCRRFDFHEALAEECIKYYDIIVNIEKQEQKHLSSGLQLKMELFQAQVNQSNLEKENTQLESLMNTDDLTQIGNRRRFRHDMKNLELKQANTVAIIMIDVDYFKEYNDYYGHQKGDDALIEIGRCLKKVNEENIKAYRYGGDEFSIIIRNKDEKKVKDIVENIKSDILKQSIKHDGYQAGGILSVSCGYAFTTKKEKDFEKLLKEADDNLYKCKKSRNGKHI